MGINLSEIGKKLRQISQSKLNLSTQIHLAISERDEWNSNTWNALNVESAQVNLRKSKPKIIKFSMFDRGLGQGRNMRECGWKGRMTDGLLPHQFLMFDEDEEFSHEGSFSLNGAKWNRAYIGDIFVFFFFSFKKIVA